MSNHAILIVDDEYQFIESLSEILKKEFRVFTASNVSQGLQVMNNHKISLLLLDLQMREESGLVLLEKLRNTGNHIPVLIITGNSCHEWAMKCADFNVQGYITKPIDILKLICRIKKLLGIENFEVLRELWGDAYDQKMSTLSHPVRKALCYIHQNYHGELNRETISAYLDVSPDYLSRQFYKACGIHLKEYINRYRIYKSKEFLRNLEKQVGDISATVGFMNINYFCKLFKDYTGITPKEYRKRSWDLNPSSSINQYELHP